MTDTPVILLVHGAWHGAWCWRGLTPELDRAGLAWRAMDLPGHGARRRRWNWTVSLDTYAQAVAEEAGHNGPVIAVGHSMGGCVVTAAAELEPGRFCALVYLAGFLPVNGESLLDVVGTGIGGQPVIETQMRRRLLRGDCIIPPGGQVPSFYEDCTAEDITWAQANLQAQPLRPFAQKPRLTPERSGRAPRYYIACSRDNAIPHARQMWMAQRTPCEKIYQMETDHSPFFSQPKILAEHLREIVALTAGGGTA